MALTAAREKLLVTIRERILAYAASRIGKDSAEDLTQDALMLLEQKYAHVEPLEELLPLAFQIVRFKMVDHRRKSHRRGEHNSLPVDEMPIADGHPDPAAVAQRRELEQRLAEALSHLEGRCRKIFRMKLDGRSFAEIQKELGAASINTVYTWDFRCRKQLLDRLGDDWR
ncbi:MAG: RNA polymerase sigma factor [Bryobacteraceae bacterium]